jgi:acetylornithine deacetylase/succinyl-diaminopimelate desuccinylase-like protein
MAGRRDPLAAAARGILLAEEAARSDPEKLAVATVGQLEVFPGCTNVIPEKVRFTVEVRHANQKQMDRIFEKILQGVALEAERRNVALATRELASNPPIRLDPALADRICVLAGGCGMGNRRIYSGAVHDASMLAAKTRTGMIFVPSAGGRSHVKEEDTPKADLLAGSQLFLDTIRSLLERPLERPAESRKP